MLHELLSEMTQEPNSPFSVSTPLLHDTILSKFWFKKKNNCGQLWPILLDTGFERTVIWGRRRGVVVSGMSDKRQQALR